MPATSVWLKDKTILLLLFLAIIGASALQSTTPTSGCWRVALNIGREPFTTMPTSWASSGARFPLVIKCNFTDDGVVSSMTGDVRFTGPEGEVVTPVQSGTWYLENDGRDLSFSLTFLERLERRGVALEKDCTIQCEGLLFSDETLNDLDQKLYAARSSADQANKEVQEVKRRKEAPKNWNFDTGRWEKRYKDEFLISNVAKKVKLFLAEQEEKKQRLIRPMPVSISIESGDFPGISSQVSIGKSGKIKMKGTFSDAVVGTWGAEPINENPASYYRPSY